MMTKVATLHEKINLTVAWVTTIAFTLHWLGVF